MNEIFKTVGSIASFVALALGIGQMDFSGIFDFEIQDSVIKEMDNFLKNEFKNLELRYYYFLNKIINH